jgi:hypothetical protein
MLKVKIPPFHELRGDEKQSPLDKLYSSIEPKPASVTNVYIGKSDAKVLRDLLTKWAFKQKTGYTKKKIQEMADNTWCHYGPNESKEDVPEGYILIE